MRRQTSVAGCLGVLAILVACHQPLRLEYDPGQVRAVASRGLVVSEDPIAARIGAEVLAEGGNAVDAAVATAFALAVSFPEASPVGGGGFAVIVLPGEDPAALDFRETAPAAATADMFLGAEGKVDRKRSLDSPLAVAVPGGTAGLAAMHERFGRLPWERLLEPAVRMAADGFAVPERLAKNLERYRDRLDADPDAREIFLGVGETLVQADLARTLAAIRDRGPRGFSEGAVASAIAEDLAKGGGLLTPADLSGYEPVWRDPARFPWRGSEVLTMPLPSSAGVVLPQVLGILEAAGAAGTRPGTPERLHLLVEAERRAFADRNAHLGDPAGIPEGLVEKLVSSDYLARRAATIEPGAATPSHEIQAGDPAPEDTTHVCVVDAEGGAVALTVSLNRTFGSGLVAAGTGVLLNDHMDDFAAKPGEPNLFGLHQGAANAIVPGRRPLSSMSPTVVQRGGEVVLVLGAAGGPRILSAVVQVLEKHIGDGLPLDVAVLAPRVHHQHRPDRLQFEDVTAHWPPGASHPELDLTRDVLDALDRRGHPIWERDGVIGRLTAIARDPRSGSLLGVADARTTGAVAAEGLLENTPSSEASAR
jgi:gamma-glutamyltranspeptidase/glutathione hydrolase